MKILLLLLLSVGIRSVDAFAEFHLNKNVPPENKTIWSVDWSADDRFIASGGVDSVLRIFNSDDLTLIKSIKLNSWIHVVEWHPSRNLLAIATLENYVLIYNFDNDSMESLGATGGSRAIGWNRNGLLLAVGDLDGGLKIFSAEGKLLNVFNFQYSSEQVGTSFLSLNWHPSEDIFVVTNYQLWIFDREGRKLKEMKHTNAQAILLCTEWHPSGTFFVAGDYGHNWEGENVPSLLHFWQKDGSLLRSVTGSEAEYRNIAWSGKGSMLASASDCVRIWTKKGKLIKQSRKDSTQKLWGIAWNGKSDKLVTSSDKGVIAVWDKDAQLLYSKIP